MRAAPEATAASATTTTRRKPKRPMRAAANGPVSPNRTRFTDTAAEIVARLHPKSCSSGSISTPGAARNPAAASSVTNVVTATTQA